MLRRAVRVLPRDVQLVADRHHGAVHRQAGRVEVDVTPLQPEVLAASHAGVRSEPESVVEPMAFGGCEERPELRCVPGPCGGAGEWPPLRCVSEVRRIRQHHASTNGIVEGAAQYRMDLEDGLVVEAAPAINAAGGAQGRVEPLKVIDAQVAERNTADVRNDVQLDVAAIAVPRARPECQLLRWQPALH